MGKTKHSGFIDDLGEDQIQTLEEFKKVVKQEGLASLDDPRYDDCEFLKFLRARKFKLKDTLNMFRKYIEWRKTKEVDNKSFFEYTELEKIRDVYPHGYHKTCKEGRPIYIERVGLLNLTEIFKLTTEERIVEYFIREYEKLILYRYPGASRAAGRKIEQSTTILDCKHGSMKIMSKKVYSFIKLASQIGQDYYPEILGQMFIVNAPFIFSAIWAIVRGFIDEKTRKKINIIGGKYQKKLLAAVDAENLPIWLGGDCTCEEHGGCLLKEVGPWMEDLSLRIGSSGEILPEKHNPTLVPRYVGEKPPEIKALDTPGSGGGYKMEEAKNIEDDDVKAQVAVDAKVEAKEGEELSKSDSMKAEAEAGSSGS